MRTWRLRWEGVKPACRLMVVMSLAVGTVLALRSFSETRHLLQSIHTQENVLVPPNDSKVIVNQAQMAVPDQHLPSFAEMAAKAKLESDVSNKSRDFEVKSCSFEFRRERIEHQCRTAPPPRGNSLFANRTQKQPGPALTSVVLDHERKIMGCLISKVSSTSWMQFLDKHTLVPNAHSLRARLRRVRSDALVVNKTFGLLVDEVNTKYKDYKKYIIVKHPMQRLVSAYYETVINRKMFNDISLDEFMERMASREMVGADEHWALYSWWCYPCDIRYDYVVKMETFEHDLPLLNQAMGISKDSKLPDVNRNKYVGRSRQIVKVPTGLGHDNLYRYEKELVDFNRRKPAVYQKAQQWYQPDMDMFGYSWDSLDKSLCGYINTDNTCC